MNTAKIISLIGVLVMTVALANGFINGNIGAEGAWIAAHPWGIVSLVDVYIGFILFCGWIFYREKSFIRAVMWTIALMVLGNFVTSLYVLLTVFNSNGNWKKLWMGSRVG